MKKVLACLALVIPLSSQAEFIGGDVLYNNLMSSNVQLKGQAQGYILGVFDALVDKTICPSPKVTSTTVVALVVKQLYSTKDNNKEYSASSIVEYTLKKEYPCHKVSV